MRGAAGGLVELGAVALEHWRERATARRVRVTRRAVGRVLADDVGRIGGHDGAHPVTL